MTKNKVRRAIGAVLKSVRRDLRSVTERMMSSGAVDINDSRYSGEVLIAKLLVKAALKDEHDHFALPDDKRLRSDLRNLRYF